MSYFELFKQRAFIAYFASLDLCSLCYCVIKKTKELLMVYRRKKKHQQTIKFLSSREHPGVLLYCVSPTFMLLHYCLFLKFFNNFEISCQDKECHVRSLHLKMSLHFKSVLLIRADDYLINFYFILLSYYFHFLYKCIGIISYKQLGNSFGNLFGFIVTF